MAANSTNVNEGESGLQKCTAINYFSLHIIPNGVRMFFFALKMLLFVIILYNV